MAIYLLLSIFFHHLNFNSFSARTTLLIEKENVGKICRNCDKNNKLEFPEINCADLIHEKSSSHSHDIYFNTDLELETSLNHLRYLRQSAPGKNELKFGQIDYPTSLDINFSQQIINSGSSFEMKTTFHTGSIDQNAPANSLSFRCETCSFKNQKPVRALNIINCDPGNTEHTNLLEINNFTHSIDNEIQQKTINAPGKILKIDWSVQFADQILKSRKLSSSGSWNYAAALVMEGLLRVYNRTNDQRYLEFVINWANIHISSSGEIDAHLRSLDNMMPAFMLMHLYEETKIKKFKLAIEKIRENYIDFPRTSDGGFWHNIYARGQLWLDGLYMSMPFYASYGKQYGKPEEDFAEVYRQFRVYTDHLWNDATDLLLHGYTEGDAEWAIPPLNRSALHWGRSIGWVVMGLSEVIEIIPPNYSERDSLINLNIRILKGLAKHQDPETGLWYQIIDKPDDPRNWLETSCTMMYIMAMKRAIQLGFLDESYEEIVKLGYKGVLSKIKIDNNGLQLTGICEGTSVSSDIQYYYDRQKRPNDYHGIGSFLIMNELIAFNNFPWSDTYSYDEENENAASYFFVYPNPSNDFIQIQSNYFVVDFLDYEVLTPSGSQIFSGKLKSENNGRIDLNGLQSGLYLIRLWYGNNSEIHKILRQ